MEAAKGLGLAAGEQSSGAGWCEGSGQPAMPFFAGTADTLPRSGEQECKNPMALYILKDKVSQPVCLLGAGPG